MKIDSVLIIKNEENNIETLVKQLLIFSNEIHITDTGSTDNTLKILKRLKKENSNLYIHKFEWDMNFSNARNYSLTCYKTKADYQFWCDGDDTLNDKLIETILNFTKEEHNDDIYYIKYKYFETDNNPHWRTSMLRVNAKLKWVDPIHEFIEYTAENKLNYDYFNNGSLLIHHKLESHNNRNIEIFFNMDRTKWNFTSRNRYYYARELEHYGLLDYALFQYKKCIDSDELNYVDKNNAFIALTKHNDKDCLMYFEKLCSNFLVRKDSFYYMGDWFFRKGNIIESKIYYNTCIEYSDPPENLTFLYDINCITNSYLQLNLIEFNSGNMLSALNYNQKILEIDKNNQIALNNIIAIKNAMEQNEQKTNE